MADRVDSVDVVGLAEDVDDPIELVRSPQPAVLLLAVHLPSDNAAGVMRLLARGHTYKETTRELTVFPCTMLTSRPLAATWPAANTGRGCQRRRTSSWMFTRRRSNDSRGAGHLNNML